MELLKLPQWVCWRLEPNQDGKQTKIPYNIYTGARASVSDCETWHTYQECLQEWNTRQDQITKEPYYNGIGFVFTDTDPFCCIDIDDIEENMCFEIEEIVANFKTYQELSQSGNGIHIIFKGKKDRPNCRTKNTPWLEVYDCNRWLAITGNMYGMDTPKETNDCQEQLNNLMNTYFPQKEEVTRTVPTIITSLSDQEIIDIASNASNGARFKELWEGGLVGADASSEDQALCNILAFYTQGNAEQIDSLFRQSKLMREKWNREDYRRRTISKAISDCTDFYKPQPKVDLDYIKVNLEKIHQTIKSDEEAITEEETNPLWAVEGVIEDFSDVANANYFYKYHKNDFIYTNENWYYWNNKKWEVTTRNTIRKEIQKLPSELKQLFNGINDKATKKEALKWAKTSGSSAHISGVATECQALYEQEHIEFDSHPHLINCLSGVIDLKNNRLLKHDKKYYCSKMINCKLTNDIPVEWLCFLNRCLENNEELINYLQKVLGYCLTGENSEQTAYFLCGSGQTGKSTLMTIIGKILGEYNYNAPSGMFMDSSTGNGKFDLVNLYGKRLCCTNELSSAKTLASEIFKKVTGGDTQDCDRKFKQPLRVHFIAKVLVATNDLPTFNMDYAINRRLKFIKFDKRVENPDDSINDKLWEERDAIFSWLVVGAQKYYAEGVGELDSMKEYKAEAIKNNNEMLLWLEDNYSIIGGEDGFIPKNDLWNAWSMYCKDNNITNPYKGTRWFTRNILDTFHNVTYKQVTGGDRGFKGIRPKY